MKVHGRTKNRRQKEFFSENSADSPNLGGSAFLLSTKPIGGEKMRRRLGKHGQSTLEYVLIWTAIVGAILLGANTFLRPAVENAVDVTSQKMEEEVNDLVAGIGNP
jgi:hypothetical protein